MTDPFDAALREHGYRRTAQRFAVWEAVGRLRHATPEQIAADLPDVDLSTVYRALEALVDCNLITHTHMGHGPPVYHAVDPRPHLHLVCQRCGGQWSADIDLADGLTQAVLALHDFAVDIDYMSLPGTCAPCRAGEQAPGQRR